MLENGNTGEAPDLDNEYRCDVQAYLEQANLACSEGDDVLGMHLYLTAFEKESSNSYPPSERALAGLRAAWRIACDRGERTMAEHIFEKLEPYLATSEIPMFADRLQQLAFDKLAELGIPREDLENMAQAISTDVFGGAPPMIHIDSVGLPFGAISARVESNEFGLPGDDTPVDSDDFCPTLGDMIGADAGVGDVSAVGADDDADDAAAADGEAGYLTDAPDASAPADADIDAEDPSLADVLANAISDLARRKPPAPPKRKPSTPAEPDLAFADLAGYRNAVAYMRSFGIGMQDDEEFQKFVAMLNEMHGTDRMPSLDTMLFRSGVREDANRFVRAVIGELGLPAMRMTMEENLQGIPVLCLSARSDVRARFTSLRNGLEGPGVLVLEDIDTWTAPYFDEEEEPCQGGPYANLARGAYELIGFIRAAAENPDVYVIASASNAAEIDPFFYDVLEPVSIIEIEPPDEAERTEIWEEIARDHPSIADVSLADLTRFSEGMARYDMYMAAREAVDEAYKASLAAHEYIAVAPLNIFEKLACYHNLDSQKYSELEQAVVDDFRNDLDHLEDLLDGQGD